MEEEKKWKSKRQQAKSCSMQEMVFFTPKKSLFLAMIFECIAQVAPLVPIYRKMGHMTFYVRHMGWAYIFLHVFCVGA